MLANIGQNRPEFDQFRPTSAQIRPKSANLRRLSVLTNFSATFGQLGMSPGALCGTLENAWRATRRQLLRNLIISAIVGLSKGAAITIPHVTRPRRLCRASAGGRLPRRASPAAAARAKRWPRTCARARNGRAQRTPCTSERLVCARVLRARGRAHAVASAWHTGDKACNAASSPMLGGRRPATPAFCGRSSPTAVALDRCPRTAGAAATSESKIWAGSRYARWKHIFRQARRARVDPPPMRAPPANSPPRPPSRARAWVPLPVRPPACACARAPPARPRATPPARPRAHPIYTCVRPRVRLPARHRIHQERAASADHLILNTRRPCAHLPRYPRPDNRDPWRSRSDARAAPNGARAVSHATNITDPRSWGRPTEGREILGIVTMPPSLVGMRVLRA